ncbi:hypothetical protein K435DRAFT_968966 [Dendrothele bispora CBS 962.96]|uniref:DUF7918 domain-containing protein n=1 Tax=Dendrothele bispora (strain CBS 962.96) TaxID=1314807 RepID=A0A4S8LKF3_DENBC|nr:hypothetical protein K435DRAFT_968966 [Dendrothele bispora CBS 962.96]
MLFNNFSASIKIDGKLAEEFQIEVDEARREATCWIASELGKTFRVEWQDNVFITPTTGRVHIDGTSGNGSLITKPGVLGYKEGFRVSDTGRRPFMFSALKTTDDDSYLDTALPNGLGEIRLVIWRVILRGYSSKNHHSKKHCKYSPVGQELVVHEKRKKALNHSTRFPSSKFVLNFAQKLIVFSLGAPLPTRLASLKHATRVGTPVATFCFRYRPLDVLQANGIAPPPTPIKRPPSPEILDIEDSDEDADEKELARLRAQADLVQARIESRRQSQGEPKLRRVKAERVKEEYLQSFVPGEVIDLT